MPSMRIIKNRIRSVGSTQQITRAMNLVAASKLNRVKSKMLAARPFVHETKASVGRLVQNEDASRHPLVQKRDGNRTLIVLVTSDRGLCGGYSATVCKEAWPLLQSEADALLVVGSKGRDYFVRRHKKVIKTVTGISEEPFYEDAADIGRHVMETYNEGTYDRVLLVYTLFRSTISHEPHVMQLLPVEPHHFEDAHFERLAAAKGAGALMSYEPGVKSILGYMLPKYVNTMIYGALEESAACQQAARMTSMDAATENAEKMIATLTIKYNRARQGAITQELNEIVSGANALS